MAVDPGTLARRYAPVLLLVAVQAALAFIAPSTPPKQADPGSPAGLGAAPTPAAGGQGGR